MTDERSGLVGLEPFAPEAESGWYSAMEQYWHAVAYAKDLLDDQPLAATLLGRSLALVRTVAAMAVPSILSATDANGLE